MQTGMYAISEMASLFNVSRQTLIYYDKIGLFKPAVVNEKGYRFYSPTQIPLMRLICMLRDLGLELDEIDRLASTFDISEMTDHLRSRVQALDEQIAGLKAERASVKINGGLRSGCASRLANRWPSRWLTHTSGLPAA